jgi:putative FmdB family regulatory protein
MPLYDYRCRTCDDTFEVRRSMAESDTAVTCPAGHAETVKLLAFAAIGGRATAAAPAAAPAPMAGGGCCGGACGCG